MKSKSIMRLVPLMVISVCILFFGCKTKLKEIPQADSRFIPYIAAYTTGTISSSSSIRIRLTEPSPAFAGENKTAAESLFSFSPSVEGEAIWIDRQTVEFKPSKPLEQDQVYSAKFFLGKVRQVDAQFNEFKFGFHIMQQSFEVQVDGLVIENPAQPDRYTLEGKIVTSDVLQAEKMNEILSATCQGNKAGISWTSDPSNHIFSFHISNIQRSNSANNLHLSWNGKSIGTSINGEQDIPVPSTQFYGKLSHRYSSGDDRELLIYFSDLLDSRQDLRGIVSVSPDEEANFRIQGNILKVVFMESFSKAVTVRISTGLLNTSGKKLPEEIVINVPENTFTSFKPQLRAIGNGTILPSSQGLIFPFEAVNLKSVKLTIIKIYESNIAQFLQDNTLEGNNELQRVGRPVFSKVIPLTNSGVTDFSKWNRFTIDMNEFIQADPGAIYQVNLTFSKRNILYPCPDSQGNEESLSEQEQMDKMLDKFDNPSRYYYYDPYDDPYGEEGYRWSERDNPCNPAYYTTDKMIFRNILATDIGLIMKRGTSGDMMVAVTDIRTAKPMSDVSLEVLDFQLQKLTDAKSNGDGFATFRLDRKPFLLIAKNGSQRSYLRIDDQSSLSLSNFDVSGTEVQKGLKGFIYGERGVWRPGDSLFMTFILQDRQNVLPPGHPVVFELKNPSGQLITRIVKPNDKTGMFSFRTATTPDAPTGKWTAVVKTGGSSFTSTVRIETVKPNRLKVNFQLNKNIPFGKSGIISANLHAQWLHGALAGNLKSTYEVVLVKAKAAFKSYTNFSFDDPGVSFTSETMPVFDGKLDASGNATISKNLQLNKTLPAALNAYFKGKVFEPGGDFSVDFITEPVLPYETYIGLQVETADKSRWLEAGKDHLVYLASVNRSGQPVTMNGLHAEIFKVNWSWWWDEDDSGGAEYVSSNYNQPVASYTAATSAGKGSFRFNIKYPAWGRYYIKVTNPATGQSCGQFVYIDWPSYYGRTETNMPGGATMLVLSADKNKCKIGETVTVTVPGMQGARALVSLENGSRVIDAYWVDAGKTENLVKIKTLPEMTPNIYIHVTVIQPHKDKKNDLPIRQYGVLSLDVEDSETVLNPAISMADILKPEQKVTMTVSERSGKAMNYTIAVVDEGLLDLTHFKTPDPHATFFAHEAIGVKTFDLFDQVIGAFGGTLERLLSVGGDEILKQEEKGKSLRFKPVVKFMGPFTLAAGKTATHSFIMPNYIGSVRAMVVASSQNSYGFAEKTVPVKQNIMVMATLPRVVRPGEEILMPVNVFSMSKTVKTVTVSIRPNNLFSLTGNGTQTVSFQGEGDKVVYFRMRVADKIGSGKIDVTGTSGSDVSRFSVDIPVLAASMIVHRSTEIVVPAGGSKTIASTPFGFQGTNKATLALSKTEKLNLNDRIAYLVEYPYGCTEQITSTAFAQLYLSKVTDMDKDLVSQTEFNIRQGIKRIINMQNPDGGFIYWRGENHPNEWLTSYAGHFLLEAMNAGYSVPDYVIARWKEYQREAVKKWMSLEGDSYYQLLQAYRLYTLALAGSPDIASMNRMKEIRTLLPQASWKLAAAYALAGKREIALSMAHPVAEQARYDKGWQETFGSELRDKAMILETMTELNLSKDAAAQAKEITKRLNEGAWLSTQECAYTILALAKYYIRFSSPEPINCTFTLNGKEITVASNRFSITQSLMIHESGKNNLVLTNRTKTPLFARLDESGLPTRDENVSFRNELDMTVLYQSKDGKPIDIKKVKQGLEFTVVVKVRSKDPFRNLQDIALRQMFPSGWEINNSRMSEAEAGHDAQAYDYRDYRDDRVYTFFDLHENREKVFTVSLTATYAGRFYFPGAFCEAMYERGVSAKDPGIWVEVMPE
jgi:alpha-2-macroglobulin